MERERTVERWLGQRLKQEGFLYFKFVSPQNPGVPDRLVICPDGAVEFVEIKTLAGKLSRQQEVCIQELERHGQAVTVVHGLNEAIEFSQRLIRKHAKGGDRYDHV